MTKPLLSLDTVTGFPPRPAWHPGKGQTTLVPETPWDSCAALEAVEVEDKVGAEVELEVEVEVEVAEVDVEVGVERDDLLRVIGNTKQNER